MKNTLFQANSDDPQEGPLGPLGLIPGRPLTNEEDDILNAFAHIAALRPTVKMLSQVLQHHVEHMHKHCQGLREHEDKIADLIKRVEKLEGAK